MLLQGKRIFYVEDDPINCAIVQMLLEQEGALVAFDGLGLDTAQHLLNWLPVDLILLDLMLPNGISGYDVYAQLQAIAALRDIPTLVITASDPALEMVRARDEGLHGFIAKPIDFDLFAHQVAHAINGEQVWYAG